MDHIDQISDTFLLLQQIFKDLYFYTFGRSGKSVLLLKIPLLINLWLVSSIIKNLLFLFSHFNKRVPYMYFLLEYL